ncbi:MAG: hypothetical protein ACU83U_09925 [Gammaproteobacteria bacterium]
MFTTLRKSTVIFLAILQLLAPLVHAHTGEKTSDLGLHVPGLEIYDVDHNILASQPISYDSNSSLIGSRSIAALPPSLAIEDIIVSVDAGMTDKKANAVADIDNSHYLHQQAPVFKIAISPFDINYSPQSRQFVCRLLIPSLSPRAPPAQ